jgi:hypothetical protein
MRTTSIERLCQGAANGGRPHTRCCDVTESLRYNRELGILIRGSAGMSQLAAMVDQDVAGAASWT